MCYNFKVDEAKVERLLFKKLLFRYLQLIFVCLLNIEKYRVFFKFHLIVGVEDSIVNAPYRLRITDQLFKSYVLHDWCVHNRLAYYEVKFKKNTRYLLLYK
jgi:hypothetical protein